MKPSLLTLGSLTPFSFLCNTRQTQVASFPRGQAVVTSTLYKPSRSWPTPRVTGQTFKGPCPRSPRVHPPLGPRCPHSYSRPRAQSPGKPTSRHLLPTRPSCSWATALPLEVTQPPHQVQTSAQGELYHIKSTDYLEKHFNFFILNFLDKELPLVAQWGNSPTSMH